MDFADKYLLRGDNRRGSPLKDIKKKSQLNFFPISLERDFYREIKEVINQNAGILDLMKLGITTVDSLKEQTADLIRDLLDWYQKRYHNKQPQKRKRYEEHDFLPFLFPSYGLSIRGQVSFFNKEKGEYEHEKNIVFNLKHLSITRLDTNSSLEKLMEDIRTCIEYECNKVCKLNTLPFEHATISISYKIKSTTPICEKQPI